MNRKEIKDIALIQRVSPDTIDKDRVLGHFLNAFYSLDVSKKYFIFKGGTCLRKCYFEDYRFSEDLDFTLLDEKFVFDVVFLNKVLAIAEKNSGVLFYPLEIKSQFHNDIPQGYEAKIKFWGLNHNPNSPVPPPARWQTHIKLDISFSEKLLTKPNWRLIFHNYSDKELVNQQIPVYSLSEIISEKLRSLIQRNRPRDIYDIWTLSKSVPVSEYQVIKTLLQKKSEYKDIDITNIENFVNSGKERNNRRAWNSSLSNHLPQIKLPDFDGVYASVKQFIIEILKS